MQFLKQLFQKRDRIHKVDVSKAYQLQNRIGQGSMSKVWKAVDPATQGFVAVKVLDKAKLARLNLRFQGVARPTEGEIAVLMNHPNVVKTLLHGITTEDEEFLVMEYIEGVGMSYLVELQNDRMKENCIWYAIQLGEALNYLHSNEWIHRDLCPRNIMVSDDEMVKLIDFGLMVPNTAEFRKPGNRTGTANYMAPELISRQPTDERIDIFSYAVTCFEMFTGQLPWPSADTLETVLHHLNLPPKDIKTICPELDDQIAETIMQGLEKDPNKRWRTIRRMVNEFRAAGERLYPEL